MSKQLFDKIYKFLTTSPLGHITAFSIIFQVIEIEPWINQEELKLIINNAINIAVKNVYSQNSIAQDKLFKILINLFNFLALVITN